MTKTKKKLSDVAEKRVRSGFKLHTLIFQRPDKGRGWLLTRDYQNLRFRWKMGTQKNLQALPKNVPTSAKFGMISCDIPIWVGQIIVFPSISRGFCSPEKDDK
jgi:hypothetical protein